MCGIAGFLLRDGKAQEAEVRAMCDLIRHRGPDDEGIYTDGSCGIGVRRLSIIDLSTGHQPISNEDGSIWVVFNGEIYNYQELRQDLIQRGHRFTTNSDTETLVHLYEEEGSDGLHRLRGMFAFCIWDSRSRTTLLVRDRFGKKPLYYAQTPSGFYFASELKCLRAAGVPLDLDHDALRLYFQFGYIADPYSPFRSIRKLMPGSWIECSAEGEIRQGRYWRLPPFSEDNRTGLTEAETREQVRELFDESVRVRMIADVPLGAFLSGGIDSSLVVASMALQSPEPVKTFSIGFEEAAYNELQYAALVAQEIQDRSSRNRSAPGLCLAHQQAGASLRRTVRRFIGHPHVYRFGIYCAAREGRPQRRWRRRILRGLSDNQHRPQIPVPRSRSPAASQAHVMGGGRASLFRLRQELPPCRRLPHDAGPLFQPELRPVLFAEAHVESGMDAARRRGFSAADAT